MMYWKLTTGSLKLLPFLLMFSLPALSQPVGTNQLFTAWGISMKNRSDVICIRKYSVNNRTFYFTVDPETLKTDLIPSDSMVTIPASWELLRLLFGETVYIRLLRDAEKLSYDIQDAGITRVSPHQPGIDLTIDLCPSKLPLDRIIFIDLIKEMSRIEKPVPLAVCVTGRWIASHTQDLGWLDSLVRRNDLKITWINHSYNHFTYKKVPLTSNFMLAKGTDTDAEVLENEKVLFQLNILPSVFFRFPGLVSERGLYDRILELGLIPVGSDAWLAKGQDPGNGSIVLIHANGNEPVGVGEFIKLLKKEEPYVLSGRWELFDLRESLIRESTENN